MLSRRGRGAAGRPSCGWTPGWRPCASLCRAAVLAVVTIPRAGADYAGVICPGAPHAAACAVPVTVTAAERKALKKRIRGTRTAWRDRLRAQIVLAAAMGRSNARIARDLRISQDTVRKWRGRFADRGLEGLG